MTVQRRSQVGERKIFSTMGFGESSAGSLLKSPTCRFPNNRLRNRHFRHAIGIPTFGIGADREVDDHASTSVHAGRVRPWDRQRDRRNRNRVQSKNRNISRVYYRQNRKSKSHRPRDASKTAQLKRRRLPPWNRARTTSTLFSRPLGPKWQTGCRIAKPRHPAAVPDKAETVRRLSYSAVRNCFRGCLRASLLPLFLTVISLDRTCHGLLIETLHHDEQDGDRDGDHDRGRGEAGVPVWMYSFCSMSHRPNATV